MFTLKVKVICALNHHTMRMWQWRYGSTPSLTSSLEAEEWLTTIRHFWLWQNATSNNWIGNGWALELFSMLWKEQNSVAPAWNRFPTSRLISLWTSQYTDWDIRFLQVNVFVVSWPSCTES